MRVECSQSMRHLCLRRRKARSHKQNEAGEQCSAWTVDSTRAEFNYDKSPATRRRCGELRSSMRCLHSSGIPRMEMVSPPRCTRESRLPGLGGKISATSNTPAFGNFAITGDGDGGSLLKRKRICNLPGTAVTPE